MRTEPNKFTSEDYAARMARVVDDALEAGLDGVIVTPGPDLLWLTGYRPTAITERLTMLVLAPNVRPTLLGPHWRGPMRKPPKAQPAWGSSTGSMGQTRTRRPVACCSRTGSSGISDSAWAMHLLGLQAALPDTRYRALSQSLPMMRAVKDANELDRLARAGAAADATYGEIVKMRFAGRRETEVAADLARLLREFGMSRSTSP